MVELERLFPDVDPLTDSGGEWTTSMGVGRGAPNSSVVAMVRETAWPDDRRGREEREVMAELGTAEEEASWTTESKAGASRGQGETAGNKPLSWKDADGTAESGVIAAMARAGAETTSGITLRSDGDAESSSSGSKSKMGSKLTWSWLMDRNCAGVESLSMPAEQGLLGCGIEMGTESSDSSGHNETAESDCGDPISKVC